MNFLKGCGAYAKKDLCPEEYCRVAQGSWCAKHKCQHYTGKKVSEYQKEKGKK